MRQQQSERGCALTMTLMAAALLIPLGALAVLSVRTLLLIQQHLRSEAESYYAAEAGLEWATAASPVDTDDDALLAGPDGVTGSFDDGNLPFGGAPAVLAPPLSYSIRISSAGSGLLRFTATGLGASRAATTIEQLVRRSPAPYSPGALYVGAALIPTFGTAPFVIDGHSHTASDAIGAPTGAGKALPALAYPSMTTATWAAGAIAGADAGRLVGLGSTPSIGHDRPVDLSALAGRAATRADAVHLASVPHEIALGTSAAPQLTVIDSDAAITGPWTGAGVLVIRGRLQVAGSLSFTGLVITTGGFIVDPGATVAIRGGVWIGAPPFDARGTGGIAACDTCLATADATYAGLLPHRLVPCGRREVF